MVAARSPTKVLVTPIACEPSTGLFFDHGKQKNVVEAPPCLSHGHSAITLSPNECDELVRIQLICNLPRLANVPFTAALATSSWIAKPIGCADGAGTNDRRASHLYVSTLEGLDLCRYDIFQLYFLPAFIGQQHMCARERLDTLLYRGGIGAALLERDKRTTLSTIARILGPVIDFKKKAVLGLFECLNSPKVGDVDLRCKIICQVPGLGVEWSGLICN